MGKLFEELKRRKVFKVGGAYAIVAWVLIQVSGEVLPTFNAPEWVQQTLTFLFFLGFPITLIMAWAYEVTPEGIKADDGTSVQPTAGNSTDRKLIYVVLGIVTLLGGFQITDRFFFNVDVKYIDLDADVNLGTQTAIHSAEIEINPVVVGIGFGIKLSPSAKK